MVDFPHAVDSCSDSGQCGGREAQCVLNVNDEIEVWVMNRVFQVERDQIYS